MDIFTATDTPPPWCELRSFSCETLTLGQSRSHARSQPRARVLMTKGRVLLRDGARADVIRAGQYIDPMTDAWHATASTPDAEYLVIEGCWGQEVAGCGLWTVQNEANPSDGGDPVTYPKTTRIDSHYHDYDEYWFVLDGAGTAVVGDGKGRVQAGDCLATRAGVHHDLPEVEGTFRAAFFETTLLGQKRLGHLWEHTHGPAHPFPKTAI